MGQVFFGFWVSKLKMQLEKFAEESATRARAQHLLRSHIDMTPLKINFLSLPSLFNPNHNLPVEDVYCYTNTGEYEGNVTKGVSGADCIAGMSDFSSPIKYQ